MLGYLVDRSCLSVDIPLRYVERCIVGISLLLVPLFLFHPSYSTQLYRYPPPSSKRLGSFSKELVEISLLDIKPPFNGPLIQIGFSNFFLSLPPSLSLFQLPLLDQRPKRWSHHHFYTRLGEGEGKPLIPGILSARFPRGIQNG